MGENCKIYVCGTPIGNLEDITLRAIKILKNVDLIAAEDTRRTSKLLNHFEIDTSMTSYHEHNEKQKAEKLISRLKENDDFELALVSDAGVPGISDPGFELINRAVKAGIEIIPVPGPTALISALIVSGLPMGRFVFEGFIPREGQDRENRLNKIKKESRTIILYESPQRIITTLKDLQSSLGDRQVAVIREISKVHEEKIYGTFSKVLSELKDKEIKGEIVIVVAGREKAEKVEEEPWEEMDIVEHVELFMENGYTKKEAIKKVAEIRDLPKRKVYKKAIAIEVDI